MNERYSVGPQPVAVFAASFPSLHTSFHFTRLISAAQRLAGEAELSQLSQLFQIISIRS